MSAPPFFTAEQILRAFPAPAEPFTIGMVNRRGRMLRLPCAQTIHATYGKRGVFRATWRGREAAAKLYAGRSALREARREARANRMLREAGLPTPELFDAVEGADRRSALLLFEYLPNAHSAGAALADARDQAEKMRLVERVLELIFAMYEKGLWQRDCHLGNFLLCEDRLYLIDLGRVFRLRLGGWTRRYNLIKMANRQPPSVRAPLLATLEKKYGMKLRPWQLDLRWSLDLRKKRRVVRGNRGNFSVSRERGRLLAHYRNFWPQSLQEIFRDPESAAGRGKTLQRTEETETTLIRTEDGEMLLQCWAPPPGLQALRPSRAWEYWQNTYLLAAGSRGDIRLPQAPACAEERRGPLRGRSWLLRRPDSGKPLAEITREGLPEAAVSEELKRIFAAFYALRALPANPGADGFDVRRDKVFFTALEEIQYFRRRSSYRRAWGGMKRAFLSNWPAGHPCRAHYGEILEAIPRESAF